MMMMPFIFVHAWLMRVLGMQQRTRYIYVYNAESVTLEKKLKNCEK
jgi:hypothetical protein